MPKLPYTMTHWKDQYEAAAGAEFNAHMERPMSELVAEARRGQKSGYHQLWQAIGARGTPAQVGWVLFDVLLTGREYLERYHCAGALLRVLRCTEFEAVDLAAMRPALSQNLERVRQLVEQAAGPRPA